MLLKLLLVLQLLLVLHLAAGRCLAFLLLAPRQRQRNLRCKQRGRQRSADNKERRFRSRGVGKKSRRVGYEEQGSEGERAEF